MMKLLITLVIVLITALIVAVGGGYFLYSSLVHPQIISENDQNVLTCADSDGNDIYIKGATSYTRDEPGTSLYEDKDSCDYFHPKTTSDVGLLRESWCEGLVLKQILTTCGRGYVCKEGRCISG